MASIKGIGWLTRNGYGGIAKGTRNSYHDGVALRELLFSHPFKNFGRLDAVSVKLCYAVALALSDAGIAYSPGSKQEIGIIGTNKKGCLNSDILYFRDYLESGRTLGRGALFIYTLPSSPLGEAAIHFGLQGPLFYASDSGKSVAEVLSMATDIILFEGAPVMLAGAADKDEALFFVVARDDDMLQSTLCSVEQALSILAAYQGITEMVDTFSQLNGERNRA